MKIGLLGMGTVGGGVRELAERLPDVKIARILERVHTRPEMTNHIEDILRDDSISLIVETMGGLHPAYEFAVQSLESGRHFVTANKLLVSAYGRELQALARRRGVGFLFGAACGGGIPYLSNLAAAREGDHILRVGGILNGTTNYMLDAMQTRGLDYAAALREAQALGYAEADPTLDIDGHDAAHKLTLLIRLAYGVNYPYTAMPVRGIRGMSSLDIALAREFGYRIKLIAQVRERREPGQPDDKVRLEAGVFPALVPYTVLLARVGGVYNAVRVSGNACGPLFFHGRGAGDLPTAGAVLADLMAVARDENPHNPGHAAGRRAGRRAAASQARSGQAGVSRPRPAARRRGEKGGVGGAVQRTERKIFGVPERFMRPRLILIATVVLLTAFGCLMIYSASSISSLTSDVLGNDPAYYLKKQLQFIALGGAVAFVLAKVDYHEFTNGRASMPMWAAMVVVLVLVFTPIAGQSTYGASRWINLPLIGNLQPSEFAKIGIVWLAAGVCQQRFDDGTIDDAQFVKNGVRAAVLPLALIVAQPDKGTTMVIGVALLAMLFFAGFDRRYLVFIGVVALAGMVFLSVKDSYSLRRIQIMFDPFQDYYKDGYQLAQGQYAFGSGGLFGVGIGMSRMKYSYLPMAHNDFIFAIIGEECGLVGTLGVLAAFGVIVWQGMKIARCASDLSGRLVAVGCTSLLAFQMLLNVCGVIGIFPLSGKPIPFLSYGGSSIMASLLIVGALVSVSVHSSLPETVHDRTRRTWQQVADESDPGSLTFVSDARPRSARGAVRQEAQGRGAGSAQPQAPSPFRVVAGGAQGRSGGQARPQRGRVTTDANGRRRIDLGPSASDRLRGGSDGPRTRR